MIWRGWGGPIALLTILAGFALGMLVAGAIPSDQRTSGVFAMVVGAGVLLGGLGTFALGWWLNRIRPRQELAQWRDKRRAELDEHVRAGRFSLGPGHNPPTSLEQAQAQSDQLYAHEEQQLTASASKSHHTLWFVPIQWLGAAAAVLGILLIGFGGVGAAFH